MPILFRYLLRHFFWGFLRLLAVFTALFFLLDGAEQVRRFLLKKSVHWHELVLLLILRLPDFLVQFLPPIAFLTTLAVLMQLARRHEITVMRASTVSLYRILIPFLFGGVAIGLLQWAVQDQLLPRTNPAAENLLRQLKGEGSNILSDRHNFWLRDGHQILYARHASSYNRALLDVIILEFDDQFALKSRVDARKAEYRDGHWRLFAGTFRRFGETIQAEKFTERPWQIALEVERLEGEPPIPESLAIFQLWLFVDRLEREGYDATPYRAMLHRKIANPFIPLAAIVLAFPFSLRLQRQGNVTRSALTGLVVGFAMFILSDFALALGAGGKLPSLLAAWLPALFFSALGGLLLLHVEEGEGV